MSYVLPFVRDLLLSVEIADLIKSIKTGTESTMKTKHGVLNEGGHRKEVEEVSEVAPDVGISILAHTFVVEPVARAYICLYLHLGNLA